MEELRGQEASNPGEGGSCETQLPTNGPNLPQCYWFIFHLSVDENSSMCT